MKKKSPIAEGAGTTPGLDRRTFVLAGASVSLLAACGSLPPERPLRPMFTMPPKNAPRQVDVAIVGGSFAGLSAAYQLVRASRTVAIFDTSRPRNRFATSVHGIIGHDGTSPLVIRDIARNQLMRYPTTYFVNHAVTGLEQSGEEFQLHTEDQGSYSATKVILSYGLRDILPDRPGFQEGWGQSVLQCPYCHGYEVRQQQFGLLYTSEASLHQIRIMPDWSDDIVFFADGNDIPFEAIEEIRARNIRFEPRRIRALDVSGSTLRSVVFEDGHSVDRQAMFLITKNEPATGLAQQIGCTMEDGPFGKYIATDNLQETDVSGIYAAGDVARPIHNLTWASSDGVSAGIFAHQSLLVHSNPYHKG